MTEVAVAPLEYTPTWIVAGVCSIIVLLSLAAERCLHHLGKTLKKRNQKPLFEALQKVKEELMLLGFISLLLTVFQTSIQSTCIPAGWTKYMLPCKRPLAEEHLVAGESSPENDNQCRSQGKAPLMSLEAIHRLHIFIFVLALTHVAFSVLTITFGGIRIRQWKSWENEIQKEDAGNGPKKIIDVHQSEFVKQHYNGFGKGSAIFCWLRSFGKQFFGSVTKSDYTTMRCGFIKTHCPGNPRFDFHKYMMRALEADFKKVVGISWYLWVFVVIFLLLNVNGWHTYFWIAFLPLFLLLAVGTKLEHIITQLALEVAEKHSAVEGHLVVNPSDEHFWFSRPKMVLYLIHFILFQNSFEIAFFFWILITYGFDSCIMGQARFIVPRLVLGVLIQLLCSYSTLPLYAIVTQMGTHFKKEIFEEHVQVGLLGWAKTVKKKSGGGWRSGNGRSAGSHAAGSTEATSVRIEMSTVAEEKEDTNVIHHSVSSRI